MKEQLWQAVEVEEVALLLKEAAAMKKVSLTDSLNLCSAHPYSNCVL